MDGSPPLENRLMVSLKSSPMPYRASAANFAAIGYRWRKPMMAVFLTIFLAGFVCAFLFREYESEMKILVKNARVELAPPQPIGLDGHQALTEEDLNTEAELITSRDVLRGVVQQLGLQQKTSIPLWMRLSGMRPANADEIKKEKAIRRLTNRLAVIVPKKSNVITVRYRSDDSRLAMSVLSALSRFYIEKHVAVHRPPEQFEFFAEQAEHSRAKLAAAEARLAKFPQTAGTTSAQLELELTENRLGDLRLEYKQAEAAIDEVQKRIENLQSQMASASPRMTTVVRRADNEYLMMQLKSTLLNLELKRTELLKKYEPSYRDVQEVDREIAQALAAIDTEEKAPIRDEATDRDPTYEWTRSELAKARAELDSQQAKAASLETAILKDEQEARRLNAKSLEQQDLQREAKTLEEAYQLYVRKREEARINDALDEKKLINVTLAQMPTMPVLPRRSPWIFVLGGGILGFVISGATGFVLERFDGSFRTVAEFESYLDMPVLALLTPAQIGDVDAEQKRWIER
jgi:uncharacterized protein involved in exopolysaccharide biosynthesis